MALKQQGGRYIILPPSGIVAKDTSPEVDHFLRSLDSSAGEGRPLSLAARSTRARAPRFQLNVIASIRENGAKLVSIDEGNLAALRLSYPGIRLVPEVFYSPAWAPKATILSAHVGINPANKLTIRVIDGSGNPVGGADIIAFSNFRQGIGDEAVTRTNGEATLNLPARSPVERLYVYPKHSLWPQMVKGSKPVGGAITLSLESIDPRHTDALRHFYKPHNLSAITHPVTVAVIDSGVGPHDDLILDGGQNMVFGQVPSDFTDIMGHGTHVAGIIGATGNGKTTIRGIAPGTRIRSYRVFGSAKAKASNFDIIDAINKAIEDRCDLINLSLGYASEDPAVSEAIADAYNAGIVCFAAAGNEYRAPVCHPAAANFSIAISAMGRKGTWPARSAQQAAVKAPYSTRDRENFIAAFSNYGPEIDMVAPGVGILSTYPGNFIAVQDGTSMACPAAVGAAARLLAGDPALFSAPRDGTRAGNMIKLFAAHTKSMGFNAEFEGGGFLGV